MALARALLCLQALFLLGRLASLPPGNTRVPDAEPSSDHFGDLLLSSAEFLALLQRRYGFLDLLLHDLSEYQAAANTRLDQLRALPRT